MSSLANTLSQNTLNAIVNRFNLAEHGEPYKTLVSPMSPAPVGQVRVFSGGPVHKMVYIGLTVPPIGLDSHMIFAFTAPDSPTPHFTLDSVLAGPHFAFHLDMIPRVDLGANLAYINELFQPLTEIFDSAKEIEGLTPAHLSPRQYAIMSPWMLAYRATEEAFAQIDEHVEQYLAHWFKVVEAKLSVSTFEGLDNHNFSQRDQRNRAAIFNPAVDPVWAQIDRLLGEEVSKELRELLIKQDV
ncbi:hypothetical protein [Candidatus Leptofilum sp.]|uniref:hypothetical protein n=1 Tax=Candidatus Leptofilum sp. TaxID=3241576 RepID=UPI003B594D92